MTRAPWTDSQVEILRRMRAGGSLNREIASALGRSNGAVKDKIKALGLPKPDKQRAAPPGQRQWQWKRRDGSTANRAGRNKPRSIMKPASEDAATCMAEVRDAVEALTPRCCRWPIGDVGKPGFRFCGARKETLTGPYCAEHTKQAWRPLKPRVFRDTALASDTA